jgi:hypothetical protein
MKPTTYRAGIQRFRAVDVNSWQASLALAGGGAPKLGVEVITYPAMEAAPTKLPVTGGETSNNGGWVLLFAGVALAALGLGWRYARPNSR